MSVAFQQSTKDGTRSRKWKNAEKKIFEGNKSAIALCSLRRYAKVWGLPWGGRDLPPRERPQTTAYRCKPQSSRWVVFTTTRNNRKHHTIAAIIVDAVIQRRTALEADKRRWYFAENYSQLKYDGGGEGGWTVRWKWNEKNIFTNNFSQADWVSHSQRSGLRSGTSFVRWRRVTWWRCKRNAAHRSHICCDGIS